MTPGTLRNTWARSGGGMSPAYLPSLPVLQLRKFRLVKASWGGAGRPQRQGKAPWPVLFSSVIVAGIGANSQEGEQQERRGGPPSAGTGLGAAQPFSTS